MANGLPKPKCGWPEPADQWNINGAVICRKCHGELRFNTHIVRWEHLRCEKRQPPPKIVEPPPQEEQLW